MKQDVIHLTNQIIETGRAQGLNQKQIAIRAGITPETLSRIRTRGRCDMDTMAALARAVGRRFELAPASDYLEALHQGQLLDD